MKKLLLLLSLPITLFGQDTTKSKPQPPQPKPKFQYYQLDLTQQQADTLQQVIMLTNAPTQMFLGTIRMWKEQRKIISVYDTTAIQPTNNGK